MTDTARYDAITVHKNQRIYVPKTAGVKLLIARCRPLLGAELGVPALSDGQTIVGVLTAWLREREAAKEAK
jgi:hypothetical protein